MARDRAAFESGFNALAGHGRHEEHRRQPAAAAAGTMPRGGREVRASPAGRWAPRSDLVTSAISGISTMPAFMNCRLSPETGWTRRRSCRRYPRCRFRIGRRPRLDPDDIVDGSHQDHGRGGQAREAAQAVAGRHASGRTRPGLPGRSRRVRSPSRAPPLRREDGSTAMHADGVTGLRGTRDESAGGQGRFADAGRAGQADHAGARVGISGIEQVQGGGVCRARSILAERRAPGLPFRPGAARAERVGPYAQLAPRSAACAAASRAIGTR